MLTRRRFVQAAAATALVPLWPRLARALPEAAREALGTSPLVYVCPLRRDGSESTCHAEIWFGWIDGKVVVITGRERWRARSVRQGLDRARIWVGDHGRWKGVFGTDDSFRTAPSFEAAAELSRDRALFGRLMAVYATKYPRQFPDWEANMRRDFTAGKRILVVYTPA